MSKKKDIPSEGGNVNWEKLERKAQKSNTPNRKKKKPDTEAHAELEAEVQKLSEQDKSLPYPDEFLAEINLMRKQISGGASDLSNFGQDEEDTDEDEVDDEVFDDDFDDEDFDDEDLDDDDDFDEDDEDFDEDDEVGRDLDEK